MRWPNLLFANDVLCRSDVFLAELSRDKDGRQQRRRTLREAMVQIVALARAHSLIPLHSSRSLNRPPARAA